MGKLFHNVVNPSHIYLGSSAVTRIMVGAEQVWPTLDLTPGMGKLYNYYAITGTGAGSIAPSGWHVPTRAEYDALLGMSLSSLSTWGIVFGGFLSWHTPTYPDATYDGAFRNVNYTGAFGMTPTLYDSDTMQLFTVNYGEPTSIISISGIHGGASLRLIKDDSTWSIGDVMTGNDGTMYATTKIGSQVWMTQNSKETQYRDHSAISNVTGGIGWGSISYGAWCWYDNNHEWE